MQVLSKKLTWTGCIYSCILERTSMLFGKKFLLAALLFVGMGSLSAGLFVKKIDELDTDGLAQLHRAVLAGDAATVNTLLKLGAKVDIKTNHSQLTPLHIAAALGRLDIINLLLDKILLKKLHKFVNMQDNNGYTALHCACFGSLLGNLKAPFAGVENSGPASNDFVYACVNRLILAGANVNAISDIGVLPVHLTLSHLTPELLELLHNSGCNFKALDRHGHSVLDKVSGIVGEDVINSLVGLGVPLYTK